MDGEILLGNDHAGQPIRIPVQWLNAGLGVIVQTREGFSKRLLPNLATKIIGRLGSASDYASLGADLAMSPSQIEWFRKNAKPGVFAAQLAEGPWREPFIMRVPKVNPPRRVDGDEAKRSLDALRDLPVKPAMEYARWEPFQEIRVANATRNPVWSERRGDRTEQTSVAEESHADSTGIADRLDEAERRLLVAVVQQPGRKSSEYARLATLNGERAAKARERLVELGYLREHRVATGGRGRDAIVLQPLSAAYDAVGEVED